MVFEDISKVLMVIINVIFMIFGLAALIVGVLFKIGWDEVRYAFNENSDQIQNAGDTLAYSAIVFGAFIVLVSLAGCIGACCRVKCLLVVYAIVVILLLIAEIIVVAVAVSLASGKGRETLAKELRQSLENYHEDSSDDKSKGFSALFSSLECCGVTNYSSDFTTDKAGQPFYPADARDVPTYGMRIPITCCKNVDYKDDMKSASFDQYRACLLTPNKDNAYTTGCLDEIYDEIESKKSIIIGVSVAIFVIEILVVIMSFILCCRSDEKLV